MEIHFINVQRNLSGIDLGEVEDIIDQRQQVMSALTDGGNIFLLFLIEWTSDLFPEALREAENRIQRRSQLMAHVGQKFILYPQGPRQVRVGAAEVDCTFLDSLYKLVPFKLKCNLHLFAFGNIPGIICETDSGFQIVRRVFLEFVGDPHHSHDAFITDNGDHNLADDGDVPLRDAFPVGQHLIVVLDERPPLANRLRPDSGLIQRQMGSVFDWNLEEVQRVRGPRLHPEMDLILIHEVEEPNCTAGQLTYFIYRP